MSVRSLKQRSFFDPEFVMPGCLKPGTTPWLLGNYRSLLFPRWLWSGWRGEKRLGRKAWPAPVLLTLLLLRWSERGTTRVGSVRRAQSNAVWRAAMGLTFGAPTPNEKTLREFEAFMRQRHESDRRRYDLLHEHIVRLCLGHGVVSESPGWAMDSTPMWCFGAVQGTVRLLGDGLRILVNDWARATRSTPARVAADWALPHVCGPSTKGAFAIDWSDPDARADVVEQLAAAAVRCAERTIREIGHARASLRPRLLRRCRALLRVVRSDLELDGEGRRVVAKRVARDRIVSITDPDARHGRKSKSRTFKGYKLHLLGDMVSGLISAVAVTPGNHHDGSVADRLVRRAVTLDARISRVMGDTAYGAAGLRHLVQRRDGVAILAPPPPPRQDGARFRRSDFKIDFEKTTATCPNGTVTTESQRQWSEVRGEMTHTFRWPAATCAACPIRSQCNGRKRTGHVLKLHPYERELREARAQWDDPETRRLYRQRSQCERLVNQMTRHGCRKAAAWGIGSARQQAHAIATTCNLGLLARAIAEKANT